MCDCSTSLSRNTMRLLFLSAISQFTFTQHASRTIPGTLFFISYHLHCQYLIRTKGVVQQQHGISHYESANISSTRCEVRINQAWSAWITLFVEAFQSYQVAKLIDKAKSWSNIVKCVFLVSKLHRHAKMPLAHKVASIFNTSKWVYHVSI